jgi:hypothetical protein
MLWRVRVRLGALLMILVIPLVLVAAASGSKSNAGAVAPGLDMTGHAWPGRSYLSYARVSGDRGQGAPQVVAFRITHVCSKPGYELHATVTVDREDRSFDYDGARADLSGHVIGPLTAPREIVGLWTVHIRGCSSGPWWFDAFP